MGILGIVLFLLSISAHELGHAFAMRKYGIRMKEICILGIAGSPLVTFKLRRWFGETPVTIRPLILGAFVKPEEEEANRMEDLPFLSYGHILGGGIAANCIYAAVLLIMAFFAQGGITVVGGVVLTALFLLGLFPRYSFILFIPMGLWLLYVVFSWLFAAPAEFVKSSGSVVTISQGAIEHSKTLYETLKYAAIVSIGIGGFNAIPFYPLDGGKIAANGLQRLTGSQRVKTTFIIVSAIPLFALIILALYTDVVKLYHFFF